MMDKPLPEKVDNGKNTPDHYGLNILLEGHSIPELRNEIYCQLIKQLTNNPKPQSINRGWNMMTLCLYSFPPTPELENYLEVFIRNQPEERRNTCLVALQSIIYTSKEAGIKRQPTLKDMQDILSGTKPLRRDFMETPPDVPSWADLLKSFNELNEQTEEYFESSEQPLAGAVAPGPKNANNKPASRVKRHHASVASPAAPPSAAPPKFNFNPVDENKEEEKGGNNNNEEEVQENKPPVFKPPVNPMQSKQEAPSVKPQVQAKPQQQAPQQQAPPQQQPKPVMGGGGPKQGGNAIAELQAKLASKGGALGGGMGGGPKQAPQQQQQQEEKKNRTT